MDMARHLDQKLPPLAAIRAFEAAARHGNFTNAAAELGMTQAAVSYQIKLLEDRVGLPLFRRRPRGVSLTPGGARLAERAGEAMEILRHAFAEMRRTSNEELAISVLPSFGAYFLAPRLGQFQIDNPSVTTRVDVDHRLADLQAGEATVAIRVGSGRWAGLAADFLMYQDYAPMISPAIIARYGRPENPKDLLDLPLIDASDEGWVGWFAAAGVHSPKDRPGGRSRLGAQILTVQAAIAGDGVCLLTPVFFRDMLARGDLVQPFDLRWRDEASIYLVYPERRRNVPAVRAFRGWILGVIADLGMDPALGLKPF